MNMLAINAPATISAPTITPMPDSAMPVVSAIQLHNRTSPTISATTAAIIHVIGQAANIALNPLCASVRFPTAKADKTAAPWYNTIPTVAKCVAAHCAIADAAPNTINVVAIRKEKEINTVVDPLLPLEKGMQLIVIANTAKLQKLK